MATVPVEDNGVSTSDERELLVNPHLRVIRCSKDEVLIKHGTRSQYSQTIQDERRTGRLGAILARAAGRPVTVRDLVSEVAEDDAAEGEVREVVAYLLQRDVLVDRSRDFAQLYVESILAGRSQPSDRPRLADATVGVVGAGTLGSSVARNLAGSGVGKLVIVDPRTASDLPGLERHFDLAGGALPAGAPLADCVADHLRAVGAHADSHRADPLDSDALSELFSSADFVVVAWEAYAPSLFHAANEVALEVGGAWMTVFFDGSEAIVGPTYLPGASACYQEFESQNEATVLLRDELVLYKDHAEDEAMREVWYSLPAHAQIAAGMAGASVLRMLLIGSSYTVGRALRIDLERMAFDTVEVLRLPRCPACRTHRPAHRHLFL